MDSDYAFSLAERMLGRSLNSTDMYDSELIRRIKRVNDLIISIEPGSDLCNPQVIAYTIESWERDCWGS
jgi:hypothetical protein